MPKPTPYERIRMRRRPMIHAVLVLRGITVTDFARQIGISRQKLDRIIHGRQAKVDLQLQKKIAQALGEDRKYLFDEIPDNPELY